MMREHHQTLSHSDASYEGIDLVLVRLWIALLLLDAVLWLLFYRLGEWAWQWV